MTAALTTPTYPRTANSPAETSRLVGNYLGNSVPVVADEFTAPAAASTNSIKTSIASAATAQTYTGAALNGSIGAGAISPPRNITVTTSGVTAANAPATVTVTGTDIDGNALSETISGVNGGAATYAGAKCFASVTSLALAAGAGTAANLVFGTGAIIGLSKQAKTRAGGVVVLCEMMDNSRVATDGTFATATASPPNGSYSPNTAANGTHDYAVVYEAATQ